MEETAKPEQQIIKQQIRTGNRGLQLHSLDDMYRFGQYVTESGLAPDSFKTPEQVLVALQTGMEINLSPMQALNSIVVIKGKPTLWGDAALALVKRSGLLRSFTEKVTGEGDDMIAAVKSIRVDGEGSKTLESTVESTFSVEDAKTAKLWKKVGPWTTHPKRMLKYKARAFNLRDNFPDVLFGMHLTEEMYGEEPLPAPESDVPPRDERRSMAVPSSAVDTTRAPVQEPESVAAAIPAQVVEAVAEAVAETLPAEEKKEEHPEFDIVDGVGKGKGRLVKPELVTFQCNKCLRTFLYGKEEGKGVRCECGKGVLAEQGKPAEDVAAAPTIEEEKAAGDFAAFYVEVNGMYVVQGGQNFIEFAAYVLCLDESEVAPSKLTEEQLKQIKAYIETSGVAIN